MRSRQYPIIGSEGEHHCRAQNARGLPDYQAFEDDAYAASPSCDSEDRKRVTKRKTREQRTSVQRIARSRGIGEDAEHQRCAAW